MIVLIVVLGLYPGLIFNVTDDAVVQSLSAFASGS
jgi:NADH:ubiquinone oxidoreductase subunit 4 (subunit M)